MLQCTGLSHSLFCHQYWILNKWMTNYKPTYSLLVRWNIFTALLWNSSEEMNCILLTDIASFGVLMMVVEVGVCWSRISCRYSVQFRSGDFSDHMSYQIFGHYLPIHLTSLVIMRLMRNEAKRKGISHCPCVQTLKSQLDELMTVEQLWVWSVGLESSQLILVGKHLYMRADKQPTPLTLSVSLRSSISCSVLLGRANAMSPSFKYEFGHWLPW